MSQQEICYVKQAVCSTKDWDTYQSILRRVFKVLVGKANTGAFMKALIFCLWCCFLFNSHESLAMSRTLKKQPAIVVAAFGTTTKANATYEFFEQQLKGELPENYKDFEIRWAFTSEIVRERANKKFAEAGKQTRYRSLPQVLANLEDAGYRKVIVQPLHIFPGQEYEDVKRVVEAFEGIGLDIKLGGTLLNEWEAVFEAVELLEAEFISPTEGCNVLVTHGTPDTFPGSNSTYLGLDRYLSSAYTNVFAGGVDGVLTRAQALGKAKRCVPKRVRLVPFMYVAGDHIMNDIMGTEIVDEEISWAIELERAGVQVDSIEQQYKGKQLYKGLGFYPGINSIFIRQIIENLEALH